MLFDVHDTYLLLRKPFYSEDVNIILKNYLTTITFTMAIDLP